MRSSSSWLSALSRSNATQALLLAIGLLAGTPPATAQMTLLESERWTQARAVYQGVVDELREDAPSPTAYFDSFIEALAEKYEPCENPPPDLCLVGSCSAVAFQYSEFFPAGIQFSGGTSAGWGIPPSGNWEFVSTVRFRFRVDTAFDYQFFAQVDPGDWPGLGLVGGDVVLESGGGLDYHYVSAGDRTDAGRLGPGEYVLRGRSTGTADLESFQGAVYAAQWIVTAVANPFIITQPADQLVTCGSAANFVVATSGPVGAYSYQWRRNLTPLANSAQISGANTPMLTIQNACHADSGSYDVVVTGSVGGSPVSEPSRLARLGISTTMAVGDGRTARRDLDVSAPSPNPFRRGTTLRYSRSGAGHLRAAVFDLAGARVRTLADELAPGAGTLTWDGTLQNGAAAPHGLYLIRIEAGGLRETRKVVVAD